MNNNINRSINFDSINYLLNHKYFGAGTFVQKYNIISALIEHYFISTSQLQGFELARSKQDLNAHKKFGKQIFIKRFI
jgi:hypothetical protein